MTRAAAAPGAALVYVHGLWMSGSEGALLRRRLQQQHGLRSVVLPYRSLAQPLTQIIEALRRLVLAQSVPRVHLVGHSLGGLIILRTLQRHPQLPAGRIVMLGSPLLGSRAAQRFDRFFDGENPFGWRSGALGRHLLGPTVVEELLTSRGLEWRVPHELAVIAGSRPAGLGRLLVRFAEPNDGTVAVSETRLPGASHLTLPVSHMGLLLSERVARETGSFLVHGRFGC